jgi:hypothetical protein
MDQLEKYFDYVVAVVEHKQFIGVLTNGKKVLSICTFYQLDQVLGREILLD